MALPKARSIFGINQVTPYKIGTNEAYGTIQVLAGSSITLGGELVNLTGGSSKYPWDVQDGNISAEMSFKPKEFPPFLFKILLGKSPTEVLNDPGNTTVLANTGGTSLQDASTGIDSVGVKSGSESDLKFGRRYIVKVISATTVDVYAKTNVDFGRGTPRQYVDDTLKITDTPLLIVAATPVEVPGFGIELTGGSGTIAMVVDDTAEFDVNPPSLIQSDVKIGGIEDCIPEFGAIVTAQKMSDGTMWNFDCYRVKATGMPFGMEEKAYNEAEITAMLMYDSVQNGIMSVSFLRPTTGCS